MKNSRRDLLRRGLKTILVVNTKRDFEIKS